MAVPAFTAADEPAFRFTANGDTGAIRIDLFRWSGAGERDRLVAAWNRPGGRGQKPTAEEDPALVVAGNDPAAPAAQGGRGRTATAEGAFYAALQQAPLLGYIWTTEVAGYGVRYAGRVQASDGTERIILITDRRMSPSTSDFSVIDLRLNSKGDGEGRISVTGKVALDSATKVIAPENDAALPVVLRNVRRRSGEK
jgi:hypothetical protein